ncbi:hypothetical protein [Mucilaginibacter flavidus]|uniref:hypothetical protein n=1 Tax=Mucilaginibacter flavidus TaxID=2949309 RepID=UPI00209273D0|nr:hypothetical protein [Mucilaginibacter flavidus]MCO5945363.1 hypothetical protein [Mucilaginibacter flavidus]
MRTIRLLLFVFCAAITAMGCKKDSSPPAKLKASTNSPFFGKWELRITRGGLQPDVNFAAGNGNIVQFNADSTYAFYVADAVTKQGSFHIATQTYAQGAEKYYLIYFDGSANGEVIDVQNNMLTLGTSIADGPSYVYAKK